MFRLGAMLSGVVGGGWPGGSSLNDDSPSRQAGTLSQDETPKQAGRSGPIKLSVPCLLRRACPVRSETFETFRLMFRQDVKKDAAADWVEVWSG